MRMGRPASSGCERKRRLLPRLPQGVGLLCRAGAAMIWAIGCEYDQPHESARERRRPCQGSQMQSRSMTSMLPSRLAC